MQGCKEKNRPRLEMNHLFCYLIFHSDLPRKLQAWWESPLLPSFDERCYRWCLFKFEITPKRTGVTLLSGDHFTPDSTLIKKKFMKTVLYDLVSKIEKTVSEGEFGLIIFMNVKITISKFGASELLQINWGISLYCIYWMYTSKIKVSLIYACRPLSKQFGSRRSLKWHLLILMERTSHLCHVSQFYLWTFHELNAKPLQDDCDHTYNSQHQDKAAPEPAKHRR